MNTLIKMPKKRGPFWILIFRGDYPTRAVELNLNRESDRDYLEEFIEFIKEDETGWGIAQFRDEDCYRKGRRLVGQSSQLIRSGCVDACGYPKGIRIGRFQKLVQFLGYEALPLTEGQKKAIREERQFLGNSVPKLANDWDVSESHIRAVLKEDKPPVSPSQKPINIGVSELKPPAPSRVVPQAQGLAHEGRCFDADAGGHSHE